MPLIEKEVISPGTYFYNDLKTGDPRKLIVTPELTKYWLDQGKAMLSSGLTVPVPYEHDFDAHPMTPKEKLLNNAGEVKDYFLKGDKLFSSVDIQDPALETKIGKSIRWTSPWFNSFTDGNGKQWNNVISHLALTLRPRITKQDPFPSIAAALSHDSGTIDNANSGNGFFLSRAFKLETLKESQELVPLYPMAFSIFGGVALGSMPPGVKKGKTPPKGQKPSSQGGKPDTNATPSEPGEPAADKGKLETPGGDVDNAKPGEGAKPGMEGAKPGGEEDNIDLPPLGSKAGDVSMEEVLCDLLRALGVDCEHSGDEQQFKRNLYMAAMQKVHELTNKGMNKDDEVKAGEINKGNPPGQQPNPLIPQQEQQPMYMSLEEITKIVDPTMKNVALSMYNENVKANAKTAELEKTLNSLRDAKLKEASARRTQRVAMLSKVSPKVKSDLETMLALPTMALSMGDGGTVIDPMDATLGVLEKGLSALPSLLTVSSADVVQQTQPTDSIEMSLEEEDKLAADMARRMGAAPDKKAG